MKFIPILFSTPMVQAVLDGRKAQTRRVVKNHPHHIWPDEEIWRETECFLSTYYNEDNPNKLLGPEWIIKNEDGDIEAVIGKCPYGQVGDILWVRETYYAYGWWVKNGKTKSGKQKWEFVDFTEIDAVGNYHYEDNKPAKIEKGRAERMMGWYKRPSLFMPKAACRIFLKITNVRVERLQGISEEDAIKEGVKIPSYGTFKNYIGGTILRTAKESFCTLWQSINGEQSWNDNPWVWVIEFELIEKPKNFI